MIKIKSPASLILTVMGSRMIQTPMLMATASRMTLTRIQVTLVGVATRVVAVVTPVAATLAVATLAAVTQVAAVVTQVVGVTLNPVRSIRMGIASRMIKTLMMMAMVALMWMSPVSRLITLVAGGTETVITGMATVTTETEMGMMMETVILKRKSAITALVLAVAALLALPVAAMPSNAQLHGKFTFRDAGGLRKVTNQNFMAAKKEKMVTKQDLLRAMQRKKSKEKSQKRTR